jgi:flagellar basal body-associated protein FliL
MTIFIACVVFALLVGGGYYMYTKNSKNSTTGNNTNSLGNNSVAPINTSTNTNLGNLGGSNDSFGDGFDEFANVPNIGPPPPSTR